MVQEDAISTYPIPELIPLLVQSLQREAIPELMLYAVNCIVNLLDILPNLARVFASSGAIPVVCAKLTSIDFIDLAEGSIKALEKLGYEHGQAILQEGVLATLVELIYFFDVETQKRILRVITMLGATATNHELYTQFIEPALPSLLPHLSADEGSLLTELTLQFFHVLIDAVGESAETPSLRTESLCDRGLLTQLIDLLQSRPDLTGRVFGVLERLATNSASVTEGLLNIGIVGYITQSMGFEVKDFDKIKEALGLINALLPEKSADDYQFRVEFYQSNPQFVDSIAELVVPRVLAAFDKIDHRSVKNKSLKAFDSLLKLGTQSTLIALIDPTVFAAFVQELLFSGDRTALRLSLNIVSTAYSKLPAQFMKHFVREGVVEKLKGLSKPHLKSEAPRPHSIKSMLVDKGVPEGSPLFDHIVSKIDGQAGTRPWTPESIEVRRQRIGAELKRTYTAPLTTRGVLEKHNIRREMLADKVPWERVKGDNDIYKLAKQCLQLHEQQDEPFESSALIQLTAICTQLEAGEAAQALAELDRLLDSPDGATCSEVFQSQLTSTLFQWLSQAPANAKLLKEALPSTTLTKLVKLLILSLKFTESFSVDIKESRGNPIQSLAAIASNVEIVLRYHDEPSVDPEMAERHALFSNFPELQVNVQLFQTLNAVGEKLLSVASPEELETLAMRQLGYKRRTVDFRQRRERQMEDSDEQPALSQLVEPQEQVVNDAESKNKFEVIEQVLRARQAPPDAEQAELLRQMAEIEMNSRPLPNLHVEFSQEGRPIDNWTFAFALVHANQGEERVVLDFKFTPKHLCPSSAYVDNEDAYRHIVSEACEVGLASSSPVYSVLRLIKLLNLLKPNLSKEAFYSAKLSSAVARQSEEAAVMLTDTTPNWINKVLGCCQFLFPFDLRINFLKRTNFTGLVIQQTLSSYRGRTAVQPIGKRKFTVKRSEILPEALRIFSDVRTVRHNTLEFDYAGEEGTGLGPSLEFYFSLSKEVRGLPAWRNTGEETGLFPAPSSKEDIVFWEALGRIIGKALADDRLLELPLSPVFWKLIFRRPILFSDLEMVDRSLFVHIKELLAVSQEAAEASDIELVTYRGSRIEDLHIVFTVPGYDFIELKPDGARTVVTAASLGEYIALVVKATLLQTTQAEAIRLGLNSVIDLSKLEFLNADELETVLCGSRNEEWDQAVLLEALVAAHGYTKASDTFLSLVNVMQSFNNEERRLFLSFITGSPRLPIGGFRALSPPLTVVRKDPTMPGGVPDQYMPSVMTCQNYLKLPDYSCEAVLHRSLLYAMQEGRETFHFS